MEYIKCPECEAANPIEASVCEECNADLSPVKSLIDTANRHYNEALSLAHEGKLDEAIGQLEAAIALSSKNVHYYNLLGTIYAQKGLFSEAIRAWERALAIDPDIEKAYENIDKARHLEEIRADELEEQPKRQFALIASIVAGFFFLGTVLLSVQYVMKSAHINKLNEQIVNLRNESNAWKSQFESVSKMFPADDMNGILKQMAQSQALLEEKDKRIEALDRRLQTTMEAHSAKLVELQNQIKTLENENKVLNNNLAQIDTLKTMLENSEKQNEELKVKISQLNQALIEANERAETHRSNLLTAQQNMRDIRESRDRVIENLTKDHEAKMQEMRNQILEIRDSLALQERIVKNHNYSNTLTIDALQHLEQCDFELAMDNVNLALEHTPTHQTALFLKKEIQRILDDPLEQEIRRQEFDDRQQKRAILKTRLIERNLASVNDALKNGDFQTAISVARRSLDLRPDDPNAIETFQRTIQIAEEESQQITMMLLEARQNIENQKHKEAIATLKKVLKRAPNNEEARLLMNQAIQ